MAQPRPPNSTEDDLLQIIKAQQVTITQLLHLANEQIEIIGKLISEPSQKAAVVTGLQARLAQTSKT